MPFLPSATSTKKDKENQMANSMPGMTKSSTPPFTMKENTMASHRKERIFDLPAENAALRPREGLAAACVSAETPHVPILMLTARSTELDRVLGLELGADDYLTKPFSVRELIARIKAIFRRIESFETAPPPANVEFGPLTINADRRQVKIEGRSIDLTAREFDLLSFFANHPGRVFTRGQLLDQVWGYAHEGYEHTVNTHINRLRRKLEDDPSHPKYILTVWGVGYRFSDAEEIDAC